MLASGMTTAKRSDQATADLDRVLVQALAREYDRPEPEIERILREELGRIEADARIHTFVAVLAMSSARMRLRREHSNRH